MALIEAPRAPSPLKIRPLPTLAACVLASGLFVVIVAVLARATADAQTLPVRGFEDAGVVIGAVVDAGTALPEVVDAGVVSTVSLDAGVDPLPGAAPTVDGPPFSASEVAAAAVVIVERCAVEALRWDPSLGGPFSLVVDLPVGAPPLIIVDGLTSPVLSACVARRAVELGLPPDFQAAALDVALAVVARASLDGSGHVTWSDAAVVSGRKR